VRTKEPESVLVNGTDWPIARNRRPNQLVHILYRLDLRLNDAHSIFTIPPRDQCPAKSIFYNTVVLEGVREINELHVPLGVPIKLTMTSEDVIHDFAVPAFRIKKDVVPGNYTTQWFRATKTGRFHLFCDQYCGTNHSAMTGWVTVMNPADYAGWLTSGVESLARASAAGSGGPPGHPPLSGSGEPMADVGAKLYVRYGCNTCHSTGKGPTLVGLYGSQVKVSSGELLIADYAYIRDSILTPTAKSVEGYEPIMPTFQGQLGEEEVLQLTAYIKSLAKTDGKETKGATK